MESISGYKGSEAENYARSKNIPFIILEKKPYSKGDANGDNEVNMADAVFIM